MVRETMGDGEGDDGRWWGMMTCRVACIRGPRSAHRVTARQVHRPRELAECEAASNQEILEHQLWTCARAQAQAQAQAQARVGTGSGSGWFVRLGLV